MKRFQAFKRDITGPHLFNYKVYLFFLPVFWVTSVLSNAHSSNVLDLLNWTIANIAAIALGLIVIFIADRLLFRDRLVRAANLFLVLLLGLTVGAIKGSATTYIAWLLGSEPDLAALGSRTIQAAILGLITLPALAVLSATQARFQEERDVLVAERVQDAALAEVGGGRELDALRNALDELGEETDKPLPPLLHEVVRLNLRPLTHRLWERESARERDYSFTSMARVALMNHPFQGWIVSAIVGLGTVFPYAQSVGMQEALSRSGLTALVIFTIYMIGRRIRFNSYGLTIAYFLGLNLAVAIFIVFLNTLIFGSLTDFDSGISTINLFVWITQTAFMTSFVKGVMVTRAEIRNAIEARSQQLGLDAEVMKAKAQINSRNLANHLHSNVQNKLLLLALRLERGDGVQAREELLKIRALLDSEPNSAGATLHESLTELVDRWKGFAEISFEITSNNQSPEIIKVVNEAVNNSVRHGMAHHIEVFVSDTNSGVTVKVLDDGIGPRTGTKGLGSKYFDSVGSWSLSQRPTGGSELQVLFR